MARTASQIIDAKGGPAAFAAAIQCGQGAARMMKLRDRFPRSVWPEIMTAFPEITLEVLKRLERSAKKPRQAKAA